MNQNFNAVKKLATIVGLLCAQFTCSAQALVYKEGQLQARGHISSLASKTIGIRIFELNRFKNKTFFKSSIDSLVLLDSVSVSEYYANQDLYPSTTITRIERSYFDFRNEYQPLEANIDLAPKNALPTEVMKERMIQAEKHVSNASTSMLLSFALGIAGTLVVTNMASSATTAGELRDAGVASIAFGGVSFGLFINALIQNTKASTLLKIQ